MTSLSTGPYLRTFAAEFAKQFRVFAYDCRGRGDSGDTQPYSVEKEIDDLAAVSLRTARYKLVLALGATRVARVYSPGALPSCSFECPAISKRRVRPG